MTKKLIVFIVCILMLIGCTEVKEEVFNAEIIECDGCINYTIDIYTKDLNRTLECHEVYDNYISVVELFDTGSYYYSDRLYLYNLDTQEITEVNDIQKLDDNNRIWNFIRFNNDTYLYIELSYPELSDGALMNYDVVYQKDGNRINISSGVTGSIYYLPSFKVIDDKVYFLMSSLDDNKNDSGLYRIEMWEITETGYKSIYTNTGKYTNGYLNSGTESIFDYDVVLDDGDVGFISTRNNKIIYNKYSNENWEEYELSQNLVNMITVGDLKLITTWDNKEETDPSYLNMKICNNDISACEKTKTKYFEYYRSFGEYAYGIINMKSYLFKRTDEGIYMDEIEEIDFGVYAKVIDENGILVFNSFDSDHTQKVYRIILE